MRRYRLIKKSLKVLQQANGLHLVVSKLAHSKAQDMCRFLVGSVLNSNHGKTGMPQNE